jgi:hypothetical protein
MAAMGRLATLVVISLALGGACSNVKVGNTLDTKGAASQIAANLAKTSGLPAPTVTCPSGVKVVAGQTFDCTTSLDRQPLIIHVKLTDAKGAFTPTPDAAIMVLARVEKGIKDQVDRQTASSDSTVNCGAGKVLVKKPGEKFSCTVVTSGVSRTVEVTVKDVTGTFEFGQTGPVTTAPPGH